MTTLYPTGRDEFGEPSAPDITPLNSSGSSSRNHVEHHKDLGDAVEALQENASTYIHDHSGQEDEHGVVTHKLLQKNTHEEVDTDLSPSSIHHTLGKGVNQAAHGNHIHDFNSDEITNKPFLICTSLTRPKTPPLGMQIFETDTLRMRVYTRNSAGFLEWQLLPGSRVPYVRVLQTNSQRVSRSGADIEWTSADSDNFTSFLTSNRAELLIRETGLYDFSLALVWRPDGLAAEQARVRLVVSGQQTNNVLSTPIAGLSENTIIYTGQIYLRKDQKVSVHASHTGLSSHAVLSGLSDIPSSFSLAYRGF